MSHLVLYDYLSSRLPEASAACPEDQILKGWQSVTDPELLVPKPIPMRGFEPYWRFTSSYQVVPASYSLDQNGPLQYTVMQARHDHNLFGMGNMPLGRRRLTEVTFPGNKVAWFDFHDRHSGRLEIYHAYEQASSPVAFFDGSVRAPSTADSNKGFFPGTPKDNAATIYQYAPDILGFEPPTLSGAPSDTLKGHYRWTRAGLGGVDFGGGEVSTGERR